MDNAIDVDGLRKSYGGRTVVDDVSFHVAAGEVVALLGPNGAGKTTTVECVEGFRLPDAGRVTVLGLDPIAGHAAVTHQLGVMLQEGGVWQAATPLEVLRLFARFHHAPWRPDDLIERLGLGAVARSRYRTLSGGEKQRVNLALALVGRPTVLILDEPTAGMDPQGRTDTWELVRGMRAEGVAVLLTTHHMREAEHLADRVAILGRGRLLADDTPAALVARYGGTGVVITTPAVVDADDLAASFGVAVRQQAAGRFVLEADDPQALLAQVPAWFAERGLALTGVTTGGEGLEEVYLALTHAVFGSPLPLPEAGAS